MLPLCHIFFNSSAPSSKPVLRDLYSSFLAGRDADAHDNAKSYDKHVSVLNIFFLRESRCAAELRSAVVAREQLEWWCKGICSSDVQLHVKEIQCIYKSSIVLNLKKTKQSFC